MDFTAAMDYIEAHLTTDFAPGELDAIMALPAGMFARFFPVFAGISLSEYVRRRRLTRAACDLINTPLRVVDIALTYGYDSADAFTAAFKRMHGVTPTAARNSVVTLKTYPRLKFELILKGELSMDYRIEAKPAFSIAGGSILTTPGSPDIPKFWQEMDFTLDGVSGGAGIAPGMLGVCYDEQPDSSFRYMIGAEGSSPTLETLEIPAATWAIFTSVGPMPGAIQAVWRRIMSEFFPSSGYRISGAPQLEVYPDGDPDADDYVCEVWIPVEN